MGRRTFVAVRDDDVQLLSSAVAFWWFIALFPGIVSALLIYGLVADPETVARQSDTIAALLPDRSQEVLTDELTRLTDASERRLGLGLVAAVAGALWTASAGVAGLLRALALVYSDGERRSFVHRRLLALGLTLGALAFLTTTIGLLAVTPVLLERIPLVPGARALLTFARWPALLLLFGAAVTLLYRVGPVNRPPRKSTFSVGAVVATGAWLIVSAGFSVYVQTVARYQTTYGGIAGIVTLLLWLFATAFVILFGAELDAAIHRMTVERS